MSVVHEFPNPRSAEIIDDVIAVGGLLNGAQLKKAYSMGIFPWPHEGYPLLWFCPEQRGVLYFAEMHISKSLTKWIKKNESNIVVKVNEDFLKVINECKKQKRPGQKGSWINSEMIKAYSELNQMSHVLTVSCWRGDQLISGIYGVHTNKYVSCESMFFTEPNASKFAFIKLVQYLKTLNYEWMDLQMVTDVSGQFGARYIERENFLNLIDCGL